MRHLLSLSMSLLLPFAVACEAPRLPPAASELTEDAGHTDAGELDPGALDAGGPDAGTLDAGEPDAGELDAGALREGFPVTTPQAAGVDDAALRRLYQHAQASGTTALIIIKGGRLVVEDYFGASEKRHISMSASKSIVSLCVGLLIDEGKLRRGQPAADFIPEWRSDPAKSTITIDHLLTQTSGLDPMRALDPMTGQQLRLNDHLITSPMDTAPGAFWLYNNNGVDALALVAQRAAQESLDAYFNRKVMVPLGGAWSEWMKFADGSPMGAGELLIRPLDLAKIGQLMLHRGEHQGQRIVSSAWVDASVQPSTAMAPEYGLLWWRNAAPLHVTLTREVVNYWLKHGYSTTAAAKLDPMVDVPFTSVTALATAITQHITPAEAQALFALAGQVPHLPFYRVTDTGPMHGYFANGWLGQWLFVEPELGVVAVRMHWPEAADYGANPPSTEFHEFPDDVRALFPAP